VNLLDSLLDAIVRLDGDALVMHVGEKPYVVTTTSAMSEFRGPLLWGQVDLSSRVLTSEAVLGLLGQILPVDQRQALEELGAIEHVIDAPERHARFSVIAARAGDEVWVEMRRRPIESAVAAGQPVIENEAVAPDAAVDAPVIRQEVGAAVTAEAVDQSALVDYPATVSTREIEAPSRAEADAASVDDENEETQAPFEIVHEINQDAPTDADVDELLAESAAALLKSAAPAIDREPLDIYQGAWQELEAQSGATTFEAEPELISLVATASAAASELQPPDAAMRLASETESIAIASELAPVAIAPYVEHVPLVPEVQGDVEISGPRGLEPVAAEREPELVLAGAEAEYQAHAFVEELDLHEDFRFDAEVIDLVAEPVATVPERELVLVGAGAHYEPVAFAEDFRLVPPSADVFAPAPVAGEAEPEPCRGMADAQPELFAFIADAPTELVQDLSNADYTDPVLQAVAAAEPATPPVAVHEQPVMASVPTQPPAPVVPPVPVVAIDKSAAQPERTTMMPPAAHVIAVTPRTETSLVMPTPVRPEPPPAATASPTADRVVEFSVDDMLRVAAARGGSTVYLVARSRPMVRAEGDISPLEVGGGAPLEESEIARLMLEVAPEPARDAWQRGTSAEWIRDVPEVGRVRCMTFRDHRGPGLIFRMIPLQAISADRAGLTHEVQALCGHSDGLVLVTGPRATGKSTLMSALVDLINNTRSDHVITVEGQIEFVHESRRSFVSQREIPGGDEAVVSAVRSALREDPDVLFIGELSSADIAAVALEAVESGRLVVASLPAPSTVAAVDRLLELLPGDRSNARASMAASLRAVVAEVLVGRTRGGRVAAREVLLNTAAVAGLIEEAKTDQLPVAIENGRRHGMMPLNDVLAGLVREGTVHVSEAYRKAFDKDSLLAALRQEGVDTSFAEKIA